MDSGYYLAQGFWKHLRIFIELTHRPLFRSILVMLVVFLSDDELIFILLFETMISQAYE